ncbi:protein-disulfide reductase DsbD domain-containing protein [Pedobacter jejuensis]|uniref:Sugar transporter n=1 Tax=Pedobacter jejuensis TaxID=1268550 RepID=A0A3N0BP98_9SPHI|nr:protein-disulfide reductase DsbD domain-containing protein [Pedobacter jejuensis]RNL50168.1 sugar transporter [Pedobacter jejuensis]
MRKLFIVAFLVFTVQFTYAQFKITSPVKWSYAAKKEKSGEATVYLKATIAEGWHIYAQNGVAKALITSFNFSNGNGYVLVGKTIEPKPLVKFEKVLKANVSYFEHTVVFQQKIKMKSAKVSVAGKLEFTVCNAKECRPAEEVQFNIPVS